MAKVVKSKTVPLPIHQEVGEEVTGPVTKTGIRRLDSSSAKPKKKAETTGKKQTANNQNKKSAKVKEVKKKFVPKTYKRPADPGQFGMSVYEYINRLLLINDGVSEIEKNTYTGSLFEALKEVKLIDKAIRKIKFKGCKRDEVINRVKSLNSLHVRKKTILSIIAKINTTEYIELKTQAGNVVTMTMYAARMQMKELSEYAKRIKDSKLKLNENTVEDLVKEIDSVVMDIELALLKASEKIVLEIPR